jgi:hypothetical protein
VETEPGYLDLSREIQVAGNEERCIVVRRGDPLTHCRKGH